MCKLSSIQTEIKRQVVAGLKAGLEHLAMSRSEEYNTPHGKPEKDTWLCWAIGNAEHAKKCTKSEANAARDHIMEMLGNKVGGMAGAHSGYTTIYDYLREGLKIPKRQLSVKNVQLFRKRWAEHMIAELS